MIRAVGERDISAQETAHMLLSLPLVSCTFNFTTLSLTGDRKLSKDTESGQLTLQQSLLDSYSTRTTQLNLSLVQFAAEFSVHKGEVRRRSSPVIVRTFPQYSSNPRGDDYNLYYKYQLVKHKPWSGQIGNVWGGGEGSPTVWVDQYHSFLQTDGARERIPHFVQELHSAQLRLAEEDDSEDEETHRPPEHQDDWMALCQLNPRFTMRLQEDSQVDWSAAARQLPSDVLRECPKWISSQRHLSEASSNSPWHRQLPPVDVTTLNPKQLHAYDLIKNHHIQLVQGHNPPPLHAIVSGTAGTGKSYLISAIAQLLNDHCILTGTTGMASFNICGKTLHSALQLPVHRNSQRELQGAALQRLQLRHKDKHYLIIDEMSMMGHKMLAWVDKRLRQASGKLDSPLGGFSVILFGDFGQLPPVGDKPLYAQPSLNDLSLHGHHIYQIFTTVIVLDQIVRQGGTDPAALRFRELLLRLRGGTVTYEDWQMLLARSPNKVTNYTDFDDALQLFYDKESVAQYNMHKLESLGQPIARINAINSNPAAASTKADDAGGLHPVLFLAVGARVMLTANLWQEVGLCNGAAGTVHQILYHEDHQPPDLPVAVFIHFDTYTGPSFIQSLPNVVPIPPITFEWPVETQNLSRQQLPLLLRYAITIHKCQGQTLQKAVIDIGKSELAAGCTFVAISRLPRLECGLIQPMSFERLKAISSGRNFARRKEEEIRLQNLSALSAL